MQLDLLPLRHTASVASGVYETKSAAGVRRAALLVEHGPFGQRLPSGAHPLFPLAWALRWVVSDKQKLPTPRAATPLRLEQSQAEVVQWWGCRSPPPTGPVLGQGRVIRRSPGLDHLVSDDLRPGMFDQVSAAGAVAEHPVVLPGLIEPAEVPVDDRRLGLVEDQPPGPKPTRPGVP